MKSILRMVGRYVSCVTIFSLFMIHNLPAPQMNINTNRQSLSDAEKAQKEKEEKHQECSIEELNQKLLDAAARDDSKEVERLLRSGADINATNALNQNILMIAAINLSSQVVIDMEKKSFPGSDDVKKTVAHAVDNHGYTALIYLLAQDITSRNRGSLKTIEQLKNKKLVAKERQKILHDLHRLKEDQEEILIDLLALPFASDINAKTNTGITPLMFAVAKGNESAVNYLLQYKEKINVNMQDAQGTSALMIAAGEGNKNMVSMLLAAGANVYLRDAEGRTARHYAINNPSVLKLIIAKEEEMLQAPLYVWPETRGYIENRSRQDIATYDLEKYLANMEHLKEPTEEQEATMKAMKAELELRRKQSEQQSVNIQARTFPPVSRNIGPQYITLESAAFEPAEAPWNRALRLQAQLEIEGPVSVSTHDLRELLNFFQTSIRTPDREVLMKRINDELARREREGQ